MKNLWLALVFLCPVLVWPQSSKHIDSLLVMLSRSSEDSTKVNLLNDLSAAYTKLDHVKAMSFARRALTTAEKIEWQEGISRSYFRIATQYGDSFDSKKSLFYFQKALAATSDKRQMSKIYTDAGNIKMFESHYSQALAYYHRALEIDESLGDKSGIAKLTLNIASVYYSIRDYPKSIAFFNKSLEQKTGDQNYKATILRNLGAAYSGMGKQQKALNYFSRSLAILEKIGNMSGKSSLLSDMALTYYDMADYAKAIRYSRLSLDAAPDGAEDKVNKAFTYGIIGDSYTEKAALNKSSKVLLDSAGYYLNKSIDMHRQLNSIRGLYDDYSSLTALEKLRGNYRGALGAFEKAITYKDSIFNTDNHETIKNLEDKRAIEVRDRELKINKITLQAEEKQKWFLVLGIGLLVIIAVLLFYQNRSRKTANRKLSVLNNSLDNANRTKTRLLSILNHDLRSPVNSFIHFLQLQKESPELLDDESKMRIENATVKSATNLLDSMEDMLLWTKDQMETLEPQFEPVAMDKIFETLKKHFSGASGVSLVFENRKSINVTTDPNYLKAILRNLVSNAVKAVSETDNAEIIVSAFSENGKPIITVTDNGAGATEDHFRALYDATETIGASHGLELHLVRDFAKGIGCTILVDAVPGKGMRFQINL